MNWIVSELFYPDEVSTAQILTDIALSKAKVGSVNVICGPIGYEKAYNISQYDLDKRINIHRIVLPSLNKNKIFERILKMLLLSMKMSWVILIKVKKKDNLLLVTNPIFLILLVSLIKKIKKFNLEILVHDVFPENLVPAGLINENSLKFKMLSNIYNYSFSNADRLIVLGEDMKKVMVEKVSNKNIKIDIIPNWADDEIGPISNFNISKYLSIELDNKIVICFAGNLGRVQGLLEFIDVFKNIRNENVALLIIGDGALRFEIEAKIKKEDLKNIYSIGPKPRSEQNMFLNACHIGLITLKKGMKGLGIPSKTYNLMAAGKGLIYIGDKGSEIDFYIKKYVCGWSFNWEQKDEIESFLGAISYSRLDEFIEKGINSKNAVEIYFKRDNVLNLF